MIGMINEKNIYNSCHMRSL